MCNISKIKRSTRASNKQMTRKTTYVWEVTELVPRKFHTPHRAI
jgi:hypothetical protein